MKNSSHKIKATLALIPFLGTLWVPLYPVTSHAAAKITSCATQVERDRISRPMPFGGKTKSGGHYGGVATAPAPTGRSVHPIMKPPLQMESESASDRFSRRQKSPKKQKGKLDLHQAGKRVSKDVRKASELYLSNDDSMSLASAQRIIYAIENFLPLYRGEIRPHEFLNYFHFQNNPLMRGETFSVNFQLAPYTSKEAPAKGKKPDETLALAVSGKEYTLATRRPAVMTFILDKSGSMRSDGKMEYLKEGLEILKEQMKKGDVINVVEFDHETCNAIEGFEVGRDSWAGYNQTVKELVPRGSTDLHKGLVEGYKLAEKFYQPAKINRVILVTDAISNTGQLSPELMASIGKYYDTQRIALSGIGVGLDFNDELLDTLTDQGKGAYLFLGIKEAIPRVFGSDFISLLETVARNVHFKASFPQNVHLEVFYGEEVSTEKADVQAIHYFANTGQLFMLDLSGKVPSDGQFKLQIEYTDPITGNEKVEFFPRNVSQITQNGTQNVSKGRLIMSLARLLEKTSLPGRRPSGGWRHKGPEPSSWDKSAGSKECGKALAEMKGLSGKYSDQETQYVTRLAEKYCSRF